MRLYAPPHAPQRWRILDDAEPIGEVELPTDFELLSAGDDHVVGRLRDELDVETIHLHRLVR